MTKVSASAAVLLEHAARQNHSKVNAQRRGLALPSSGLLDAVILASKQNPSRCVMSACRNIHGCVRSVGYLVIFKRIRLGHCSHEKLGAVRGDVERFAMVYIAPARVLLHRNMVIDVLRAICDRT